MCGGAAALWRLWPKWRQRATGAFLFSRFDLLAQQKKTLKSRLHLLPDVLLLLAMGLLIVALARPQSMSAQEVEVEGVDIYLALDMSGSMRAIDLDRGELQGYMRRGEEPPDRFDEAVLRLKQFIESRTYDRIGMVVFAKDAYLQFPLTLDYNTILGMLERLNLGDIDQEGTAIGNALGRALGGLKDSEAKTKIIILITDGDRRGGNISPKKAAESAKALGVKIFPILTGKAGATLIPTGRHPLSGRVAYQEREFPVNPDLLKEIATISGGEYFRATDARGLEQGLHEILDRFERTRVKDSTRVEYQEHFAPWVVWALALLALQFLLRHTLLRKFP